MSEITELEMQKVLHLLSKKYPLEVVARAVFPDDLRGQQKVLEVIGEVKVAAQSALVEAAKKDLLELQAESKLSPKPEDGHPFKKCMKCRNYDFFGMGGCSETDIRIFGYEYMPCPFQRPCEEFIIPNEPSHEHCARETLQEEGVFIEFCECGAYRKNIHGSLSPPKPEWCFPWERCPMCSSKMDKAYRDNDTTLVGMECSDEECNFFWDGSKLLSEMMGGK